MKQRQTPIWLRAVLVVSVALGLYLIGRNTGVTEWLDVNRLQAWMASAGAVGVLGFLAAFAIGNLLSVPGLVFIFASLLAYGQVLGFWVALAGGVVAAMVNFWMVRWLGGRSLGELNGKLVKRAMAGLEQRPVRTIFLLRSFMILSPPLNYALALSPVRTRHYLIGSVTGLIIPIGFYALMLEQLVQMGLVQI